MHFRKHFIAFSAWLFCIVFCVNANGNSGAPTPVIDDLFLSINDARQFISIRGKDINKPVLLFLHGGPGAALTTFFQQYNRELEKDFVVVCWDQRGAGKSFQKNTAGKNLTVTQLINDARVLLDYLRDRFNQDKIYLVGHSWGARLGMYLVRMYPWKIAGYIGAGQEVAAYEGERQSYQFTLRKAKETNNKKAVSELEAIGAPQNSHYLNMYKTGFGGIVIQKKWLLKLGGERYHKTSYRDWISKMISGYHFNIFQLIRWSKASASTAGTMVHDSAFNRFDLRIDIPAVQVPVYFVSGVADYNTPWPLVKEYSALLQAPEKSFTIFNKSGHSPMFEEAGKFNAFVREKFLPR